MTLTTPIPVLLFDDPAIAYASLTANLQQGDRYVQEFDHLCIENPEASEQKYLEDMYPNASILGADGKLDSWDGHQYSLGACGSFAQGNAYGSVPENCTYKAEDAIYPQTPSPHGLYLARIQSPTNPLKTNWIAIDSRVPVRPGSNKSAFFSVTDSLAPGLLLKAKATALGGAWNEITNSASFGTKMGWFPSTTVTCTTFEQLRTAISNGALCVFSLAQQYDELGQKITPSGVVYGHAHSIADCLSVTHEGVQKNLVRVQNPWGTGSEWVSSVSETSDFWKAHPELDGKLNDAKASGGNYWIDFEEFKGITGQTSFDVTHPLPLPTHPYIKYLPYTFDDSSAIASATVANLKTLAETRKDYIDITLAEATPILASLKWANGTGDRHTSIILVDPTGKVSGTQTVYWAGSKTVTIYAKAGVNRIYLRTSKMSVDRGDLQVILMAAKDFGLSVGGAIT